MRSFITIITASLSVAIVSAGPAPSSQNTHVGLSRRDLDSFYECVDACIADIAEDWNNADEWVACYDACADAELEDVATGDCDPDDLGDKDDVNECIEDCVDEYEDDEDGFRECVQECTDDFCDGDLLRRR